MENTELKRARRIIEETGTHLFLTGKAGTGKTTFLRRLREECPKRMVVLAPTGIAAINAGGVTLHSFFQLPFAPFIPGANYSRENFKLNKKKIKLIRSTELIVIDEISMVRADLLDHVDAVLRRYRDRSQPFGGMQLLMIGDLQQLAPVVKDEEWALLNRHYDTPFFFGSQALRQTRYVTVELRHVYRQSDPVFIGLLNKVREGRADETTLQALNARYAPDFRPPREEGYIRLVTHNWQAQQINEQELSALPEKAYEFRAETKGNFPESSYPTDAALTLKRGAQVMFVKNDPEHRYFNGMIGEVAEISGNGFSVRPVADPQQLVRVEPAEWTNARYALNEHTLEIEEQIEGVFRQYPVKAAWAITIHKSQGLTFEHAVIDARSAFAHGQTYVALSRLKSLEGLVLSSPIPPEAVINDTAVENYMQDMTEHIPDDEEIDELGRHYYLQTVSELFDFRTVGYAVDALSRVMEEHFYKLYPDTLATWRTTRQSFQEQTWQVALKFHAQFERLIASSPVPAADTTLQERLRKGGEYFFRSLQPLIRLAADTTLPTDNKEIKKRAQTALEDLRDLLRQKSTLLKHVAENGFELREYLRKKAVTVIEENTTKGSATEKGGSRRPAGHEKIVVPSEIQHPQLYQRLVNWRYKKAKVEAVPAYLVLQQKALLGIANLLPDTPDALKNVPYFGEKGHEKYGSELLEIVRKFMEEKKLRRPEVRTKFVPKQKAEEKEKTWETSLRLFREGKQVDAIASERQLTRGTVLGHLSRYLPDTVKLTEIISPDKISRITTFLLRQKGKLVRWAEARKALGKGIDYTEMRTVQDYIENKAGKKSAGEAEAHDDMSDTKP